MIPFNNTVSTKIGKILGKVGIRMIYNPHPTPKDQVDCGLRVPGVYQIPCACGRCYIGQTGISRLENGLKLLLEAGSARKFYLGRAFQ